MKIKNKKYKGCFCFFKKNISKNILMQQSWILFSVLLVGIFFLTELNAQPLNELLNIAATENPELKSLENEYLAALQRAPQVSQMPDTEFGLGVFPLPVETRLGAQLIRVGGTQMLPWPGTLDGASELELIKARAKFEAIATKRIKLFYELKNEWLQLYEIEKSQLIIQRNIQLLESLERLTLTKIESGKAIAADVLRVQMKITELEQRIKILEVTKSKPTIGINQLLNRELNKKINIRDSLVFAALIFNKNNFMDDVSKNHPLLKMLSQQQAAAEKTIELNYLKGKPAFGVGLDYVMVSERSDAEPANNGRDIVMVRGSVKIPLNKNKFEAKEKEENLKIEAIEWQKKDAEIKFNAMIEKAYADHQTARLQFDLYDKQTELILASIRMLESEYSATGRRFDELLQLENDLIDFELKKIKVVVKSHLVKAGLEQFVFNK